jgi:hypothetical protein
MSSDRQTILYLVAVGRITPREAERLMAMWPGEDDFILRMAVCCAILWALLPHFRQLFEGCAKECAVLFPYIVLTLNHALACVMTGPGGLL